MVRRSRRSEPAAVQNNGDAMAVCVRFIKRDAPFEPGDLHWCPMGEAEKHVRHGVAVSDELTIMEE